MPSAEPIRVQLAVSRLQRGGLEAVLLQVARGLRPRGIEFRVLSLRGPGERDSEFRQAGIPVETLGGLAAAGLAAWPANVACFAGIVRALRAWRPHVLQTHHFFSGVLGRTAGLLCRTPALLQAEHNFYAWKGPLARLLDRLLARGTDGFVVPSRAVADHVAGTHGAPAARVAVVPNGLASSAPLSRAEARGRLGLPAEGAIVGFVGRLVPSKRPGLFLDAAAELAADPRGTAPPPPLFAMLGDGPLRAECERLASCPSLARRVRLLGSVPGAGSLMPAFDLLVACSSEEGFGLAVAEAVLARVPVVAVDLPAFREVLSTRTSDQFVAQATAGPLARAVAAVLADPARAADGVERERAALLPAVAVPLMLDRYEALYRALAEGRPVGAEASGLVA